jgi:hypothetical protein
MLVITSLVVVVVAQVVFRPIVTCTGSSFATCTACKPGMFLNSAQQNCTACSTCGANQYQASACTVNTDRVCSACRTNSSCSSLYRLYGICRPDFTLQTGAPACTECGSAFTKSCPADGTTVASFWNILPAGVRAACCTETNNVYPPSTITSANYCPRYAYFTACTQLYSYYQ